MTPLGPGQEHMSPGQAYVDQTTRDRVRVGEMSYEEANARRVAAGLKRLPFELKEQKFRVRIDLPIEMMLQAFNAGDAATQARQFLTRLITSNRAGVSPQAGLNLYRPINPEQDIRTTNTTEWSQP